MSLFMAYRAADPCDRIILHRAKIVDNQFQYIPKDIHFLKHYKVSN